MGRGRRAYGLPCLGRHPLRPAPAAHHPPPPPPPARPAFRRLVRSGDAGPGTVLLDVTAATVGDLRHGGIERQARDTWAARAFALAA